MDQGPFEGHQILSQEIDGPRIVTHSRVRPAQEEVCHDLECRIPQGPSQGQGELTHLDGTWRVACDPKTIGQIGRHPAQPALVAQGLGERLRLAQIREHAFTLSPLIEGIAQGQPYERPRLRCSLTSGPPTMAMRITQCD
jgi:hypothetical protein